MILVAYCSDYDMIILCCFCDITEHTPIVVGSGMLAFGAVAASIHQKRKEQEILLRNQKPCTSIFDAYRKYQPLVALTQ